MLLSSIAVLACLASDPSSDSALPPDVVTATAEVDALEAHGHYRAAARRTEALLPWYPQDYGLHLRAAWLRFNAGHWRRARLHYEVASDLSQGSLDSRLGLGWSLLRDGRRRAALTTFEELRVDYPESPRVAEALREAEATPVVAPSGWAWLTGHFYPGHPTLTRGLGGQVGLGLRIAEHGLVSVGYGFARLGYVPTEEASAFTAGAVGNGAGGNGAGPGSGNGSGSGSGSGSGTGSGGGSAIGPGYGRGTDDDPFLGTTVDQHQVHASAGVTWPVAGVLLQYGWLRDEGLTPIHAVGTSVRVSPWGDVVLDANATLEPGVVRPRVAARWRMPVHRLVWIQPAGSMQVEGSEVLGTGRLTVGVHGKPGAVWVGGMAGRERRPAMLDVPVFFSLADDLRWGAWIGGTLPLPRGFALLAGYELYGLDPIDPAVERATAHYVTAGLTWTR